MNFRIADTFTSSLSKLNGGEQKAVKTTAFDLQMNPANPGMKFHKLDRAKDKHFWSVRVNADIRLIVHKTDAGLLLCYVGHHDDAYRWAERRKIERHPTTGAMQIVEVRELVREIEIPKYVEARTPSTPGSPVLANASDEQLLAYGVPVEWIEDVKVADEDALLSLIDHLPAEAAEAVLNLATGTIPPVPVVVGVDEDPFAHPDSQRRFRIMTDVEELQRALEYPWDRWAVFLHPAQREIVEQRFNGPARVCGSAGTGKTVVALHRGAYLAKSNPDSTVLLTTFSIPLARNLRSKVEKLVGSDTALQDRIIVRSIDEWGSELYEATFGSAKVPTPSMLRSLIKSAASSGDSSSASLSFLEGEWLDVVDAWQLTTWEAYRDVQRLGRKTRLSEKQRAAYWKVFSQVRTELETRGLVTMPMVFHRLAEHIRSGGSIPADFIVVDEAQDISVPQLRFLAAVAGKAEDGLFFAGDLGQRIFQTPFSWASLGVNIRGRSQTLRINYRTSHQIKRHADRLLHPELTDVDGNIESRKDTVSVFNGPDPDITITSTTDEEADVVSTWIRKRIHEGVKPEEIAIIVRSAAQIPRARAAIAAAGVRARELGDDGEPAADMLAFCTMHCAKGLEFRAVVVAACDDEIVPLQSRIASVTDDSDLEDVYNTERHLLYVACTRARDHLLITAVHPASEFLDDLRE